MDQDPGGRVGPFTKLKHSMLAKFWGGPVRFESGYFHSGKNAPAGMATAGRVRVIHDFIQVASVGPKPIVFYDAAEARSFAQAIMQAADVLEARSSAVAVGNG
jgi:hypothetical protein